MNLDRYVTANKRFVDKIFEIYVERDPANWSKNILSGPGILKGHFCQRCDHVADSIFEALEELVSEIRASVDDEEAGE